MGYGPDDPKHTNIGPKFAGKTSRGIQPGDVILIARRSEGAQEIVGFGVVEGKASRRLFGFARPQKFGSMRRLKPFVPWSQPPGELPFAAAVRHTMALARLHPETDADQRAICRWLDRQIKKRSRPRSERSTQWNRRSNARRAVSEKNASSRTIAVVAAPKNYQLDYVLKGNAAAKRAKKTEAILLERYEAWLSDQGRTLKAVRYGALQCDGYESARSNLIEAKSSTRREHIRMAVGQILDYSYKGRNWLRGPNMALLLPKRPVQDVEAWLDSMNIKLIWREEKAFFDNANGWFT
jgi:hypothetical protein